MLQWTWECGYLFKTLISVLLSVYPEVKLLDDNGSFIAIFWGISILFSIVSTSFLYPFQQCKRIPISSHVWQHLFIYFFTVAILTCCEMILHCHFHLYFPDNYWCLGPFQILLVIIQHHMASLDKYLFKFFDLFLNSSYMFHFHFGFTTEL